MTNTSTIDTAFVPADIAAPVKVVSITNPNDLSEMYALIGCDTVERVSHLLALERAEMWVDENGLLTVAPVLNIRASMIAGIRIYGNAIITGPSMTTLKMAECPRDFFNRVEEAAKAWLDRRPTRA